MTIFQPAHPEAGSFRNVKKEEQEHFGEENEEGGCGGGGGWTERGRDREVIQSSCQDYTGEKKQTVEKNMEIVWFHAKVFKRTIGSLDLGLLLSNYWSHHLVLNNLKKNI